MVYPLMFLEVAVIEQLFHGANINPVNVPIIASTFK
jgi:hypothetical protein